MAKEQKQEQEPAIEAPEALGPPKSYRLQITLAIAGIILFQMFFLYMVSPGQPQPEFRGGINPINGPRIFDGGAEPPVLISKEDMVERSLKEKPFSIRQSLDGGSEAVSLNMQAKIRKTQASKFDTRFGECKNEIAACIEKVLRAASKDELNEIDFTTIRAKAKKEVNAVLREPYVLDVLVIDPNIDLE